MKQECKCHGVSGSCTMKTCWMRLPTFRVVGDNLKSKFDSAARVFSSKTENSQDANTIIRFGRKQRKSIRSRNSIQYLGNSIKNPHRRRTSTSDSNSIETPRRLRFKFESYNPDEKPPRIQDLVYYETSPAFCEKDTRLSILGTQGRQCNVTSTGADSCDFMCCGRGYVPQEIIVLDKCDCVFQWCCEVKCRTCETKRTIYTCL